MRKATGFQETDRNKDPETVKSRRGQRSYPIPPTGTSSQNRGVAHCVLSCHLVPRVIDRCAGRGPLREGGGARLTFRASWGRGKSERKTREGNRVRRPRGAGEPRPAHLCSPRTKPGPRASARPANLTPAGCSTCTRPVTQWTWNTSRWAGERLAGQGRRQAEWHHGTSEGDATRRAE